VIVAVLMTENCDLYWSPLFINVAVVIGVPVYPIAQINSTSSCHLVRTVEKQISSCIENKK
jgi:hypothetical protein